MILADVAPTVKSEDTVGAVPPPRLTEFSTPGTLHTAPAAPPTNNQRARRADPTASARTRGAPTPRPVDPNGIPVSLRSLARWIVWRYGNKPNKKGKFPKLPIDPHSDEIVDPTTGETIYPNGKIVDAYDQSAWATFEQASDYARRHNMGIGFVITPELGVIVVDLDGCIDQDGNPTPLASDTVDRLDSFTQISDSERGLHVFVNGSIPSSVRTEKIEIYDRHFFAMTGDRWPGTPAAVMDRADAILDLYAEHGEPLSAQNRPGGEVEQGKHAFDPVSVTPVNLDDQRIIQGMFTSRNGQRLQALWAGDWTGYPSQSEGDVALCGALAFWTGRDPVRMDQLFRQSKLYRPQWEKSAYRNATIGRAIAGCAVVYSGRGNGGLNETVTYDGTIEDILRFARQTLMDRDFVGRRAEYHRQAALGVISLMEKAGSLECPISERTLAVVAGMSRTPARVALSGLYNKETKKTTVYPDTLIMWLIEPVTKSNGVFAGVYALRPEIRDAYRQNAAGIIGGIARNQYHNGETRVFPLCGIGFAVSPDQTPATATPKRPTARLFVENMTDDAFARTKAPKAAPIPTALNLDGDRHTDVLDRLEPLSGRLVYHCFGHWRSLTELAELCTMPDHDPFDEADIAKAFTRLFKIFHELGTKPIFKSKDGRFTLVDNHGPILANLRPRLERLAQVDWFTSTPVYENAKLKPFTPIGLAIIAYLDAQPTRSASISDIAQYCDKHPATISTTVYRMTDCVAARKVGKPNEEGERQTLAPVLIVGKNPLDKRETIVTLPEDWRQRVNKARPHLATDGVNRRRNRHYAHERLTRLLKIRDISKNQDLINEIDRITRGAQAVLRYGEPTKMLDLHMAIDKFDAQNSVTPLPVAAPAAPIQHRAPVGAVAPHRRQ